LDSGKRGEVALKKAGPKEKSLSFGPQNFEGGKRLIPLAWGGGKVEPQGYVPGERKIWCSSGNVEALLFPQRKNL